MNKSREKIAPRIDETADVNLSPESSMLPPEKEAYFESLLGKEEFKWISGIDRHSKLALFMEKWSEVSHDMSSIKNLLEQRKLWFAIKKEGQAFQEFIKEKIHDGLKGGSIKDTYHLRNLYQYLGCEDSEHFFVELLDNPAVWNCKDGSTVHNILNFFKKNEAYETEDAIIRYINNTLQPGYSRIAHRDSDLSVAVEALRKIFGDNEANKLLQSTAEKDATFNGWFQKIKSSYSVSHSWGYSWISEPTIPDKFNEEVEAARLVKLEAQYNEWLINPPVKPSESSDSYNDDLYDDLYELPDSLEHSDYYLKNKETPPANKKRKYIYHEAGAWETGKTINFHGRFVPKLEKAVPLTAENWQDSIFRTIDESSPDSYLNFLVGVIRGDAEKQKESPELSRERIYKAAVLGFGRALSLGILEEKREEALDEVDRTRELIIELCSKYGAEENFLEYLTDHADQVRGMLTGPLADLYKEEDSGLPESAKSFMIYNAWRNKSREIPDFRKLLAEKVRWFLANDLSNNAIETEFFDGDTLIKRGTSLERMSDILSEYTKGLSLYKTVEEQDIPVYWEANEKLTDLDVDRAVVFGRDGKYFFTALKAFDFGIGTKELKYVVITSNIREEYRNVNKDRIYKYLKQNGVSLDFNFIDTGYSGSLPELAIKSLADAAGIEISSDEIDKRINLLSSTRLLRKELSRKTRGDQGYKIDNIEQRPQSMYSPVYLDIDDKGKITPNVVPTSVSNQLQAWVVEHASFRNFAPRLNPEKRISYLQANPLKGYEFIQDFPGGGTIGTHPIELWKDKYGREVLIKGGPAHTLRADFLGYQFLHEFGNINTPQTELLETSNGLKLKMEFLKDWKPGGIHLGEEYKESEDIKGGLLIDALLGQYDRTPWNFMFKENQVAFIDNGGSVFSRARGGHKGFPEHFEIKELQEILSNPQFPGQPVNEAYDNFVRVENGEIKILDPILMRDLLYRFKSILSDDKIDLLIERALYLDGRRSMADAEVNIEELGDELSRLGVGSSDYNKTSEAIATYRRVIEAGGEVTYLKAALKQRRDDIIKLFREDKT